MALNLAEKTVKGDVVDSCEIQPPFHLIALGSNGSVSVSRHTDSGVELVCGHNAGRMVSPITVAVVSEKDGRGRSARIERCSCRPPTFRRLPFIGCPLSCLAASASGA